MKILSLSDHYGYYHGYPFSCYRLLYRSLACVLAYGRFRYCVASLPRESAHAATLDCATLSLSHSLSSCFVFRSCALCLVERPQNADCSDETGVVMPAPPPPPAATVRALRPDVCTAFAIYYVLRSFGSSSLFFAWARESALCASLSCALCVVCVYCLRTCLLSVLGVVFALLLVHSLRPLRRHLHRARTTPTGPRHMEMLVLPTPLHIIVTTVPKSPTRLASPPRRRASTLAVLAAL